MYLLLNLIERIGDVPEFLEDLEGDSVCHAAELNG